MNARLLFNLTSSFIITWFVFWPVERILRLLSSDIPAGCFLLVWGLIYFSTILLIGTLQGASIISRRTSDTIDELVISQQYEANVRRTRE
jgi:hypothetical protein